ncbi:MAG: glycosyltransferase family 4 protein [Candidatus Dormibacterales bacterium]
MSPAGPGSIVDQFIGPVSLHQIEAHLRPAVLPFVVAAVLAALLTPLAIVASRRLGVLAVPGGRRIHLRPTPLLGGAVLYVAFAASMFWYFPHGRQLAGLLIVGGLGAALFVIDDVRGMPAPAKLGIEAGLAVLAVLAFPGYLIGFLTLPHAGIVQIGLIAYPLTLAWLLGMQNTVNLLDGVDGLATGVVAIVAVTLLIAAASKGPVDVVVATGALAGACGGFLLFNFHPARIFMGDSGSHFLGLTLGLLSILGVAKVAVVFALAVPALALAVPIVDTGWAVIRRRRQGLSIAHPDTRHIHHQLLDFGLSQPETCLLFYCSTAILGAFGLMLFGHKRILAVAIVLLVVAVATVVGERLQGAGWRVPAPGLRALLGEERPS